MNAVTEYDEVGRLRYLADAVRRARRLRGWSQRELAARAGVSAGTVAWVEGGGTAPTWVTMDRLCLALGLGMNWFLGTERGEASDARD